MSELDKLKAKAQRKTPGYAAEYYVYQKLLEIIPSIKPTKNSGSKNNDHDFKDNLFVVEVKDHKKPTISTWWKRLQKRASQLSKIPLLIYSEKEDWYVCYYYIQIPLTSDVIKIINNVDLNILQLDDFIDKFKKLKKGN